MTKEDRKEAIKLVDEGMIFSQKLMDGRESENARERLIGQLLFRIFYILKLVVKEG